jgi:P-type Mg2+ transporter
MKNHLPEKLKSPVDVKNLTGLTSVEAQQRLKQFGLNEPVKVRQLSGIIQFLALFANPLIIILLMASAISFAIGDWVNSVIIAVMVLLSVVLNFVQTARSKKVAESLRREVSLSANVLRDGEWHEIPRREVVPEDVIRLSAGDLVPADGDLIETKNFHVQESALTGESLPVEKTAISTKSEANADRQNKIFLGTSVISGTATAFVRATGQATKFGEIAARLTEKTPETEFEKGTRQFGFFIMRVVLFLVVFAFLVNTILARDTLESLLFSIALAVGLTPEFLPMITTITLGQGALKMARQKVIVKHLEAIQNFGSIDILCSDKTGTLTTGEMSLRFHTDAFGSESEFVFLLGYLNSFFETGIKNPLDKAVLANEKVNPLDAAILSHDQPKITDYQKIDEIPFDFERRRVSVVVRHGDRRLLIVKGAPESVLTLCTTYRKDAEAVPLNEDVRKSVEQIFKQASADGLRVLAVAFAEVLSHEEFQIKDEQNLTFAGFLTFADEPLESAAETLRVMAEDGVQVKILTGDNELVTRYVCEQVGLKSEKIVLGDEIERMNDAALAHVAEENNIFARVSPMQKNRILLALKSRGHVVGFLGDGINDAPSLRSADVGISVASATDVAKDAAEIVLMERSLSVLHGGIIEGRKSFGNVMKYLLMGTSSNFGNMFSMAGAVLFLPFLPMLPVQILLNNFLYDLAQITIPTDYVDASFIRKPHRWDIKLIRDFMLYIGPISSIYDFLTFYVLLKVFSANEQLFHTGWFVESLATQTLVVFVIRTAGNPFRSRPSAALTLTVFAVVVFAVILPFTPLAGVLGFTPLPVKYYLFLGAATITYLMLVELVKGRLMKRLTE